MGERPAGHPARASGPTLTAAPVPVVDEALLVDALTALAGAASREEAAAAPLPLLLELPGVRATAVVVRSGRRAVVLASAGYDCGAMAPGAELPLDAGLPVTEAVRTGRTVAQGTGPGWLAVPFGRGRQVPGALLLSLLGPPPDDPGRLRRLARALGDALHRTAEDAAAALDVVSAALRPPACAAPGCELVVRASCARGEVGGDVTACLPDGRGGHWLLVADVVGCGLVAALVARSVRAVARAAAGWAPGPAALLDAVERGVAADVPPGTFVTAVAVHLGDGRARVVSAGHPPPLLLHQGTATVLRVEPGAPLALETAGAAERLETVGAVPAGAALLLHTDGLTERRDSGGVHLLDPADLARGLPDDLAAAADRLLAAADAVGPAEDDVSVLLVRPGA